MRVFFPPLFGVTFFHDGVHKDFTSYQQRRKDTGASILYLSESSLTQAEEWTVVVAARVSSGNGCHGDG